MQSVPGDEPTSHQCREIGIVLPNNQRQLCTLHIQKDVLPYALCRRSRRYCRSRINARVACPQWVQLRFGAGRLMLDRE